MLEQYKLYTNKKNINGSDPAVSENIILLYKIIQKIQDFKRTKVVRLLILADELRTKPLGKGQDLTEERREQKNFRHIIPWKYLLPVETT